jgi:hypothetical protein
MPDEIITLKPLFGDKVLDILHNAVTIAKEKKCIVEIPYDDRKFILTADSDVNEIYRQHMEASTTIYKTTVPNPFFPS